MKKRVLIIGGAGFIGGHLTSILALTGSEVVVVDDLSTGYKNNINEMSFKNIRFIESDVLGLREDDFFDEVYMLATSNTNAREGEISDLENDLKLTRKALSLTKEFGKIYFTSSCAVYGTMINAGETDDMAPQSVYAMSKLLCEKLIIDSGKKYVILRPSVIYGNNQNLMVGNGLISLIIDAHNNNEKIKLFNQGKGSRDYLFVGDLIEAFLILWNQEGIFNVCSGQIFNTMNIVNMTGIGYVDGGTKKEPRIITMNSKKLDNLGWKPKQGLYEYMKERMQ